MPTISDNFNISDGSENRDPIRVLDQEIPTIALSVWSQQGRGGDHDLFNADVIVHGQPAQFVLDNFVAGNPISITGELVSEIDENGYLSNEIQADDVGYVPQDRAGQQSAQPQGRDNYNQQPNQPNQGGGPAPRGGSQGNTQQGGDRQGGNTGPGAAPAPRRR